MKSSTLYLIIAIIITTAIAGSSAAVLYFESSKKPEPTPTPTGTPLPEVSQVEEQTEVVKEPEVYQQAPSCEVSFTLSDIECPEITTDIDPNPPLLNEQATFTFSYSQYLENIDFTESGVIDCLPASSTMNDATTITYTCTISETEGLVEFTGYISDGKECSALIPFSVGTFSCDGEVPEDMVACEDPETPLTEPKTYELVEECTGAWCEYICDDDHIYEDGECVTPTYSCTGDIPEDSEMCPGDNEGLTENTQRTLVDKCTDEIKCEYICDDDYTYDDGECVPITYSCTGDVPSNAELCKDDDKNLTANTLRKLVDSCTDSRKCEYVCKDDYEKDDNICKVKPTPTPVTQAPEKPELPKAGGIPPTLIFTLGGIALVVLGLLF
ncbi:MAG: hypothetical protein ACOX6V_02345 [Patescibacteria group bacterium]|jgi:hypothetical protein